LPNLLLTGFTPFDGRNVNGSWIAASSYEAAEHLEIPVVWGKPMSCLEAAIKLQQPEIIISLGEGREGWFDIETLARNERKHRTDTLDQHPAGEILTNGPASMHATINASALHTRLFDQQIPIRISNDAGQYLCEETLYCLEHLKVASDHLQTVVFVHLPPFGTELTYRGEVRKADPDLLEDFVRRLVTAVLELDGQLNLFDIASHQTENRG
jgi:pyroglutamyl-peptidase